MASQRISQLTPVTTLASGDFFPVVLDSDGSNKRAGVDTLDVRYLSAASGAAVEQTADSALASGNTALITSTDALASGNAALDILAAGVGLSEEDAIALIVGLS